MIPFDEFNNSERTKPYYGKVPFALTLQQLSFLVLLSNKLGLTDNELKLVEYLTYNECRLVSVNRFRELNYECVAFAAVLYVFDLTKKDYTVILSLIDSLYPELYAAGSTKAKIYSIYQNIYNSNINASIDPDSYSRKEGALKLKR